MCGHCIYVRTRKNDEQIGGISSAVGSQSGYMAYLGRTAVEMVIDKKMRRARIRVVDPTFVWDKDEEEEGTVNLNGTVAIFQCNNNKTIYCF